MTVPNAPYGEFPTCVGMNREGTNRDAVVPMTEQQDKSRVEITLREEVMFCMGILVGFVMCLIIEGCLLNLIPGSTL